jgi:hypothetical protein
MRKSTMINTESWVAWLGATVVAAVAGTFVLLTFAYAQFETKEHSKERIDTLTAQLNSMDGKLDRILGYGLLAPKGNNKKSEAESQ